jgi:hypothetical protein
MHRMASSELNYMTVAPLAEIRVDFKAALAVEPGTHQVEQELKALNALLKEAAERSVSRFNWLNEMFKCSYFPPRNYDLTRDHWTFQIQRNHDLIQLARESQLQVLPLVGLPCRLLLRMRAIY